jgi:hypothetical protein
MESPFARTPCVGREVESVALRQTSAASSGATNARGLQPPCETRETRRDRLLDADGVVAARQPSTCEGTGSKIDRACPKRRRRCALPRALQNAVVLRTPCVGREVESVVLRQTGAASSGATNARGLQPPCETRETRRGRPLDADGVVAARQPSTCEGTGSKIDRANQQSGCGDSNH